jgi:hypothetical protein
MYNMWALKELSNNDLKMSTKENGFFTCPPDASVRQIRRTVYVKSVIKFAMLCRVFVNH